MATIPERLTAVERDLLAHEKANKQALEAHAKENAMAMQAVELRVVEMEQKMEAFGPVLSDMDTKLGQLVLAKENEDAIRGDRRGRKLEFKDLIIIAIGLGSMVGAIVQAFK